MYIDVFEDLKHLGTCEAMLITYFIASILHGINPEMAIILLTLGLATYVEGKLRSLVAHVYDACVLYRSCFTCDHYYQGNNLLVAMVNVAFTLVAMIQIAYLCVLYRESNPVTIDIFFSIEHMHDIWGRVSYVGHLSIGLFYLAIVMIRKILPDELPENV